MRAYERAIALNPNHFKATNNLSDIFRKMGNLNKALSIKNQALEIAPSELIINLGIASIQKALGDEEEVKIFIGKSRNLVKEGAENYWYNLACIEALDENNDLALQYLQKSATENLLDKSWAWEDPDLRWIRDDPRFVEIVGPKPEDRNSEI
jgi:tetratricopeptide (TPR) repeat protein